jgi:putative lipoic acid-binding regulatory protein
MAKPKIINYNPKRTISFSNFNRLDKGLKIAIGLKWSTFIITGVAEDKKELVEDWINNNRGKYKGINIRIGRTNTRQLVLIFSGIDELKKGLSSAIKRKFRKIIVEDVSKEERKTANDWIKKNQGKYEDINIRIGVTYKGLHPNEKEKIRNKVGADVSFFDDATLHLEENDEKLFFDNWINSESPQKRIDRIEREIN